MDSYSQVRRSAEKAGLLFSRYYPEVIVFLVALSIHLHNLAGYPSFFVDEGAYINLALSFKETGSPTGPAGTFYFHPFLGWVVLGSLFRLIGFPEKWSSSPSLLYFVPRLLFVVMGVIGVILLYFITTKVYGRRDYALLASGLFAVTPLSTRYLRMVLLDSFVLFFLLLSVALLISAKRSRATALSGLVFGLAVLSKLPALFFLPAIIAWFVFGKRLTLRLPLRTLANRLPSLALWLASTVAVVAFWPVYAIAAGQWSTLTTDLAWQGSRSGNVAPWDLILARILERDSFLLFGTVGLAYGVIKRDNLGGVFPLSYLCVFIVGGLKVSSYYLIPALPFLSLLAGIVVLDIVEVLRKQSPRLRLPLPKLTPKIVGISLILVLAIIGFANTTRQDTASQLYALDYLIQTAPGSSVVIGSPAYAWVLSESRADILAYDWFAVPWDSLPCSPKTYLIIDPGFDNVASMLPQLRELHSNTATELAVSMSGFNLEIRSAVVVSCI